MKFIGFNFNKINVEKTSTNFEDLKIKTNIDVSEIKKVKSDFLKQKDELINIDFTYNIDYNPKIAKIKLSGNVILADKLKTIKEILKKWEDKKMEEDFKINLFNIILRKSNLKAMQLEDELNLPLHINLPFLKKGDN
ncbi:hypothetical protein GOV13_00960 [Candidatus Pacearchaeota archaeon]|nr:hypothetical protein [Candidatus Pacearchaeota archaeon]